MKRKILQSLADSIIVALKNAKSDEKFWFYYDFGTWLDGVCVNYFDIYLD